MLRDHKLMQERWARRKAERQKLPAAFGEFIAGLAEWDWWATPTFRKEVRSTDAAVAEIKFWLGDIERMAGKPIGYVLAEEFGGWGGRFHCHLLISGVAQLRRTFWWREAYRRFGRTRIEPFDPRKAAAYYTAKYAAKQMGNLHFGGTFAGCEAKRELEHFELQRPDEIANRKRGFEIAPSHPVAREFFRMGLGRWHR